MCAQNVFFRPGTPPPSVYLHVKWQHTWCMLLFLCNHCNCRQFEELTSNSEHLNAAQKAVYECNTMAMNNPRRFSKPCILTALATVMATPLSVVVRAPLANTIAACVGGKDAQSKVTETIYIVQIESCFKDSILLLLLFFTSNAIDSCKPELSGWCWRGIFCEHSYLSMYSLHQTSMSKCL